MIQAGASKPRLPLVLYKGLLRKAQLFDRYPILKAYSKNPLRRGTLYIPSVSFHTIVKESFRINQNESVFDVGRGFKLYREWNDVYMAVSQKITWYNQSIPESTEQKEPVVKHIESIIPGSVLISHPAAFEKNEGTEIVLILQRNQYETMGLLIKGRDILGDDVNPNNDTTNDKDSIFSQFPMKMSAEPQSFSDEIKAALNLDDVEQRKYLIVDTSGDVNAPFTLHKIDIPYDELNKEDGEEDEFYDEDDDSMHVMGADFSGDYEDATDGYDAYDYQNEDDDAAETENIIIKEVNENDEDDNEDENDEERSLDQIADDGRGRDNSPTLIMKEVAEDINNPISKADMNSKTVYKGGARFSTKYVVVYTKPNKSELEGEWLSENLYFSVFPDKESMRKSKIVTLPPQQYRIFQGYHLFQTESLEKQVADGAYFVCHTPLEILHFENNLDSPPVLSTEEIWSKLLMEMGGEFSHFAHSRKNPTLMEKTKTE